MLAQLLNPINLTLLLLPVAATTAYLWGARGTRQSQQLNQDYFQALNDLLSDRTDQAIEAFSRLAENKQDEVNLHLALGLLFRRRGELDRAIYVHHRLLKNPALTDENRIRVQLALADNYYRSGLMDRAESLLESIVNDNKLKDDEARLLATKQLLYIFEKSKEWQRAIEQCHHLEEASGVVLSNRLSHYHNELAQIISDVDTRATHIQKALDYSPTAPRPMIEAAFFAIEQSRRTDAQGFIRDVAEQHSWALPQITRRAREAFNDEETFLHFLIEHLENEPSPKLYALLAELQNDLSHERAALETLDEAITRVPSFLLLQSLLRTKWAESVEKEPRIEAMLDASRKLLATEARFQCQNCGITLNRHRWQCPGCHHWDMIYPLADIVPTPFQLPPPQTMLKHAEEKS